MEKRNTRRKKKFRLKKSFKRLLLILGIILLFILKRKGIFDLSNLGKVFGPREKELSLINAIQLDEDIKDIHIYDDYIVKWMDNKLVFLDKDGIVVNEREFDFTDPLISYTDDYIYVINKSNGSIYTINENCKAVREINLNKEIYNLKESNGNLIFHRKLDENEEITILNSDGYKIGEFIYENKNILSYITNIDNTKRITASLVVEPKFKSIIDIYDENNNIIKTLNIEDEIVMYLKYLDAENLVILTDSGLYAAKNGEIIWSNAFDLVHDIYISGDIIYILHSNQISTVDFNGKVKKVLDFEGDYNKLLPYEDGLILYGENGLSITRKNKEVLSHRDKIKGIYTDKSNIFIWTPSRLNEYEIIDK